MDTTKKLKKKYVTVVLKSDPARMRTSHQCTTVRRSTMQVAAAAAVATVDDEDGVQWWWRGGHSMAVAAFDSNGCGGYG